MANVKEFSVEEKLSFLVTLQKIESKLDEIQILKGELPMEVATWKMRFTGLHARETRIEEEINGVNEFIEQRKNAIKDAEALIKKYEKQSDNVKNNREFEAINKEMEMQTLEMKLAEKHIKDATEEIAEKASVAGKCEKEYCCQRRILAPKKGNWKRSLPPTKKKKSISINFQLKPEKMWMLAC